MSEATFEKAFARIKPHLNPQHSRNLGDCCCDSIVSLEIEVGGRTLDEIREILEVKCGLSRQEVERYINRYLYSDAT